MRARPERARYIVLYARVAREGVRSRMRDVSAISVSLSHPLHSSRNHFLFFTSLRQAF